MAAVDPHHWIGQPTAWAAPLVTGSASDIQLWHWFAGPQRLLDLQSSQLLRVYTATGWVLVKARAYTATGWRDVVVRVRESTQWSA